MRKKSGTEYPINNKLVYKRKGENEYRTQVSNKEMGREVLYLSIRESWQQQKKKKEGGDISIIHSVYQMEVILWVLLASIPILVAKSIGWKIKPFICFKTHLKVFDEPFRNAPNIRLPRIYSAKYTSG